MHAKVGAWTETGRRAKNDDYLSVDLNHRVIAIADGIGGAPFGDVISRIAVNESVKSFTEHGGLTKDAFEVAFEAAHDKSISAIHSIGADAENSGSTLLMVAWNEDGLIRAANAGDSALLEISDEGAILLTKPDRIPGTKNILSKGIGNRLAWSPTQYEFLCCGHKLLVACTDGVWGLLDDDFTHERTSCFNRLIAEAETIPIAALKLARWCAKIGGDNASAIVLEMGE